MTTHPTIHPIGSSFESFLAEAAIRRPRRRSRSEVGHRPAGGRGHAPARPQQDCVGRSHDDQPSLTPSAARSHQRRRCPSHAVSLGIRAGKAADDRTHRRRLMPATWQPMLRRHPIAFLSVGSSQRFLTRRSPRTTEHHGVVSALHDEATQPVLQAWRAEIQDQANPDATHPKIRL